MCGGAGRSSADFNNIATSAGFKSASCLRICKFSVEELSRRLKICLRYIVAVEIYRIVEINLIYLHFIATVFVLLGSRVTTG